jgi:hypothetical protein
LNGICYLLLSYFSKFLRLFLIIHCFFKIFVWVQIFKSAQGWKNDISANFVWFSSIIILAIKKNLSKRNLPSSCIKIYLASVARSATKVVFARALAVVEVADRRQGADRVARAVGALGEVVVSLGARVAEGARVALFARTLSAVGLALVAPGAVHVALARPAIRVAKVTEAAAVAVGLLECGFALALTAALHAVARRVEVVALTCWERTQISRAKLTDLLKKIILKISYTFTGLKINLCLICFKISRNVIFSVKNCFF